MEIACSVGVAKQIAYSDGTLMYSSAFCSLRYLCYVLLLAHTAINLCLISTVPFMSARSAESWVMGACFHLWLLLLTRPWWIFIVLFNWIWRHLIDLSFEVIVRRERWCLLSNTKFKNCCAQVNEYNNSL